MEKKTYCHIQLITADKRDFFLLLFNTNLSSNYHVSTFGPNFVNKKCA